MYYSWAIIGRILMILLCAWAFWRGGTAERSGAAILAVGWVMTYLVQGHGGHGPGIYVFLVDVMAMLALIALSVRSRVLWTAFMAAFQVDAVASHIAAQLSTKVDIVAYVTAITMWGGYGLMLALGGGMLALELSRRQKACTSSKRRGDAPANIA